MIANPTRRVVLRPDGKTVPPCRGTRLEEPGGGLTSTYAIHFAEHKVTLVRGRPPPPLRGSSPCEAGQFHHTVAFGWRCHRSSTYLAK